MKLPELSFLQPPCCLLQPLLWPYHCHLWGRILSGQILKCKYLSLYRAVVRVLYHSTLPLGGNILFLPLQVIGHQLEASYRPLHWVAHLGKHFSHPPDESPSWVELLMLIWHIWRAFSCYSSYCVFTCAHQQWFRDIGKWQSHQDQSFHRRHMSVELQVCPSDNWQSPRYAIDLTDSIHIEAHLAIHEHGD
jgi:hypothetical protein